MHLSSPVSNLHALCCAARAGGDGDALNLYQHVKDQPKTATRGAVLKEEQVAINGR